MSIPRGTLGHTQKFGGKRKQATSQPRGLPADVAQLLAAGQKQKLNEEQANKSVLIISLCLPSHQECDEFVPCEVDATV